MPTIRIAAGGGHAPDVVPLARLRRAKTVLGAGPGGVAALDHRLPSENPPGSERRAVVKEVAGWIVNLEQINDRHERAMSLAEAVIVARTEGDDRTSRSRRPPERRVITGEGIGIPSC